jgi:ribonuclease R
MPKKGPKKNKAHRSLDAAAVASKLYKRLSKSPGRSFALDDLAVDVGLPHEQGRPLVRSALELMVRTQQAVEGPPNVFRLFFEERFVEGKLDLTQSGTGFITGTEMEQDVYIRDTHTGTAFNGDRVKVLLFAAPRAGFRQEGQVVEVVQRSKQTYVGTLDITPQHAFLITDNRRVGKDFYLPKDALNGAQNGDVAVVELVEWTNPKFNPIGRVLKVLGRPGEHDTEIHAILEEYGLPYAFPPEVEADAASLNTELDASEIARRRDFRDVLTFTIDPADAKDFDDALSFKTLPNGNVEVGVHIADVTHYVRPGSALEREAYERATSVYLVDRVVPMLPEVLSNHVCSLRPNEDKFTFSAVFEMTPEAEVVDRWFGRTVIHSQRRLAYEEAQAVLDGADDPLASPLRAMNKMAQTLRAKRMKNGAIAFDRAEIKFKLDEHNKPLGAFLKVALDANKLIEEFMLLANISVAQVVGRGSNQKSTGRAMVYRIHDDPDPSKLTDLSLFVRPFGYALAVDGRQAIRRSLNTLLAQVKGTPEANLIETLAVRTMAKAVYSTQNVGHYGLAFDDYTHFTSPIRRYPDMMVHRLLQDFLDGKSGPLATELDAACVHSSEREKAASEAERASIKFMQAVYMEQFLGQELDGVISGVSEWGVFVEVPSTGCEGLVRLREFTDDFYTLDTANYRLVGERSGNVHQLGDPLRIVVKEVDILRKQIDFGLPRAEGAAAPSQHGANSRGRWSDTSPHAAGASRGRPASGGRNAGGRPSAGGRGPSKSRGSGGNSGGGRGGSKRR